MYAYMYMYMYVYIYKYIYIYIHTILVGKLGARNARPGAAARGSLEEAPAPRGHYYCYCYI